MLRDEDGTFVHEATNPKACRMWGKGEVWRVRVTERANDAEAKYWAWWENQYENGPVKREEGFEFVWRSPGLVDICFAYGYKAEEERGRGHMLAVDVEPLELVLP